MSMAASANWLEECGLNLRIVALFLIFFAPLWLLFSLQLLVAEKLVWWRPLTVTTPPFAFAAIAVICVHQSQRRGAKRVFLLIAAYLELAVFALILGIGVNSINGQGAGN
jgi:hypothetical protein